TLDVDLVPGQYDIYVEPGKVPGCSAFPPILLPNQTIDEGAGVWTLPPASTLTGTINGLPGAPDEWSIDLLEPSRGLPISVDGQLTLSTDPPTSYDLQASLSWLDKDVAPIMRLTHTKDPTAPTLYWSLQGAVFNDTQTAPEVHFTVGKLSFDTVVMSGQVL